MLFTAANYFPLPRNSNCEPDDSAAAYPCALSSTAS